MKHSAKGLTHEQLQQTVADAEDALAYAWEQRGGGTILLLCDRRRGDAVNLCIECWRHPVDLQRLRSGEFVVGTQKPSFLDHLDRQRWALREASKELRRFADRFEWGVIPLFVLATEGHWATVWASPGSEVSVLRYNPCTGQAEYN